MNYLLKLLNLLLISIFVQVHAAKVDKSSTKLTIKNYENKQATERWLWIRGADGLEVKIQGEIEENCDFLTIYDNKGHLLKKLSGTMDTRLIAPRSSSIHVIFTPKECTTKKGVTVTVAPLPINYFSQTKAQFVEITTQILKKGTDKIYASINQNLAEFERLRRKIEDTPQQDLAPVIHEVATHLFAMSKSYHQMGTMSKNIMAAHQSQLKAIEQLRKKTANQISQIAKERDKLNAQISKIETEIIQSTDPIEEAKKQYTKESHEKNIDNLDRLQKIWEDFDEIQDILKRQLEEYSKQIGLLLHILGADSENYKQVASIISLRESEIEALGNLPDLSKLQQVIEQIQKNETEILKQLDKIGKPDYLGN